MKKTKYIITALIIGCSLSMPGKILAEDASGFSDQASYYPYSAGSFFQEIKPLDSGIIEVVLKGYSGGTDINAVMAGFDYSSDILELQDIDSSNSFCQLFLDSGIQAENEINFICGSPSPDISGEFEVAKMHFRIMNPGVAKLYFTDNCMMLANDGMATDILTEKVNSELYIN